MCNILNLKSSTHELHLPQCLGEKANEKAPNEINQNGNNDEIMNESGSFPFPSLPFLSFLSFFCIVVIVPLKTNKIIKNEKREK